MQLRAPKSVYKVTISDYQKVGIGIGAFQVVLGPISLFFFVANAAGDSA